MKKSILFFTVVLFLFSVSSWARVPEATDPFSKTESTIPKIVKSAARPTFPEGVTPKRRSRTLAAPIDENYNPVTRQSRDGLAVVWEENFEPDAGIWYYEDVAYYWYCPDEFTSYAVRYTPFHGGSLDGAYFYFGGGDATAADFHVWADDGSGYPGASLGSLTAVPVALAGWEYVDLSSLSITVSGTADFFISFEVNGAGTIWLVSSSGGNLTGVNRSLVWDGAAWVYAIDDPYCAYDYEWCIDAMITYNDPWTSALGKWEFHEDAVRDTAHSAPFCWWVDEDITGGFKDYLTSPVFTLDAGENYNLYNFSFWVDIEHQRANAGPGSIDEYYEVYIADVDAVPTDWWHIDSFNGYDGNSWWCGDDGVAGGWTSWGYGNSWNQWVQTPNMSLPATRALYLDFMHRYDSEPAFDFCYVEISTDNWTTFDQLASYDDAMTTWTAVQIDISAYAGEDASIRFRFESDTGYSDEDGLYLSEGAWFIDNVSVNDGARTTYFEDNADDEVNFLVNVGNFDWVQLFYDYDRDYPAPSLGWELIDKDFIFNGTCNVTPYAGKNIQLQVSVGVDDSTYAHGAGLYIDDISIQGIALPEFDTQCDFLVVPYPTTEEAVSRALLDPKIIYHQGGYGSSGANGMCDVVGTGNEYPLYDFRQSSMPALAMGEYGIEDLTIHMPQYTPAAGNWNFMGCWWYWN